MSAVAPSVIAELRGRLAGGVLASGDAGYDEARAVFFGGYDRHPVAIAMVEGPDDIARVLEVARESGLPLAVRSGGHSNAGHGVADGGIVVHLGGLREIDVDARARTAWAGSGLTAGELTTALGAHAGAVGFGDGYLVGIAGLTLGGGVGLLSRRHGMTIDSVLAADVVTADGHLVRADAATHPDLFWALRGGGGNFGVVTRFQYRLADVDRVVGGVLVLPGTAGVIARLVEELGSASDDLTAIVNVQTAPPVPFIPKEQHGSVVTWINLVHLGPAGDAERAVARLRSLASPIADTVRSMRYPEILPPQVVTRPLVVQHMRYLDAFDRALARTIVDALGASSAPMRVAQLRVLGGAIARVPSDATAYAFRDRPVMLTLAAMYQDASQTPTHQRWVDDLGAALPKRPGAYVNFMKDEGPERVREAYPGGTWDRLVAVKRRYDPDNLFRLNQNVTPG